MISPSAYADHLLSSKIWLLTASATSFVPGYVQPLQIIDRSRLLLVVKGRLIYEVERQPQEVKAGQMLFVPRLVRRRWIVPEQDHESCLLQWFSFITDPASPLGVSEMIGQADDLALESRLFAILAERRIGNRLNCRANHAEAVAAVVRFLETADVVQIGRRQERATRGRRAVLAAAEWLAGHYAQPDALRDLHRRAHLSENYFREVFHRELGIGPRWYLRTLRMQAARFRLHEHGMTVKEAAASVGYDHPFHFSRLYREFWGHPPSHDRRGRG